MSEQPRGDPLIQPVHPRDGGRNSKATAVFDGCRDGIDKLLDADADMGVVERAIDAYALTRDEKDALWLWSRGRRPRTRGRRRSTISDGRGHD